MKKGGFRAGGGEKGAVKVRIRFYGWAVNFPDGSDQLGFKSGACEGETLESGLFGGILGETKAFVGVAPQERVT